MNTAILQKVRSITIMAKICIMKEYTEQGYTFAVVLDLSKYFDTLNHEILINLLRKNVKDERVVQLIKRYLKSGVMENGVGLSDLLAFEIVE